MQSRDLYQRFVPSTANTALARCADEMLDQNKTASEGLDAGLVPAAKSQAGMEGLEVSSHNPATMWVLHIPDCPGCRQSDFAAASFGLICNLLPGAHILHCPGRTPHQEVLQVHSNPSLAQHINESLWHKSKSQVLALQMSETHL